MDDAPIRDEQPAAKARAEARPRRKVVTAKAKTKATPKTAAGVRKKSRK